MATSSMGNYKILRSLNALVENILVDTVQYLTSRFNQSKSVFTASSPFGQMLIVVENLTQLIFYYIEDSITELNINEATRLTSIYSLATLAGHNPSRSMSAIGEISLSIKNNLDDIPADLVIIPNLTRLKCENNGLDYVIELPQDEIKFSLLGKDNGLRMVLRQGILETQKVVATGVPFESFSISSPQNFFIDNFFVNVYVNGEKWTAYRSILDIPKGEKGYVTKTGITNGLDLFFGNYSYGRSLAKGSEVTVEYIVNEGPAGNIRTNDPDKIKMSFQDTGFTLVGNEIELSEYIDIKITQSPFFGTNPENSQLTRLIAPYASKSFALVNPDHYEVVLKRLKLFSLVNVYLNEEDSRILNLFLIPDIKKAFSDSQDYFGADLNRFVMDRYQKEQLLRYLEKSGSKLISTEPIIIDPIIKRYVINLTIVAFDDVSTDIIKNDIQTRIADYFIQNTRRNRIPKSDLIKLIEEVNGVDSVAITILSEDYEKAKISNPNAPLVGIDKFNDIVINNQELPIIRGGFTDRYGNEYAEGLSDDSLGAINIQISEISPRPTFN